MKSKHFILKAYLALLVSFVSSIFSMIIVSENRAQPPKNPPVQEARNVFEQYLERLKTFDLEGAKQFWNKDEVNGCPYFDWTISPPNDVKQEIAMQCIGYNHEVVDSMLRQDGIILTIRFTLKGEYKSWQAPDTIYKNRYLVKEADRWALANPVKILTTGWNKHGSKYFDLHFSDQTIPDSLFYGYVDSSYQKMAALFGYVITDKPTAYLCQSARELQQLSAYGRPVPARALPECNTLFSTFNESPMAKTLPEINMHLFSHEAIHILAFKMFGEDRWSVPLLREGFAVAFEGTGGIPPEVTFSWAKQAMEQSKNPGLRALDDPRTFYSKENRNYALAGSFVKFLLKKYGAGKFKAFYSGFSEPAKIDLALKAAYEKSVDEIEKEWEDFVANTEISFDKKWSEFTLELVDR
ncbi:MAG: hypothetical protein MUP17_06345 [candidate division Zixibacteria bacterium]|nr:hypothetical protein [candidate division Zixibacteria bacterium]